MINALVSVAFLAAIITIIILIDLDAHRDIAGFIGRNRLVVIGVTVVVAVVCVPPLIGF